MTADTAENINSEIIIGAFEQVAERSGDITPMVFERYFERSEASRELMNHMDQHMLGRMMDQVLLLLMESGEAELNGYLQFETRAHASYGVDQSMYANLMSAVEAVIEESLGSDFNAEIRGALHERVEFLLNAINEAAA